MQREMTRSTAPPFAVQRIVFLALLFGMTAYAIVVAVVLQQHDGKGLVEPPIDELDTVVVALGAVMAAGALAIRIVLGRRADGLSGNARALSRFAARLVPIAMLEGGCLFALTAWLLNGRTVPELATALVLMAIAIAMVPLQDPDAAGE